MNDTLLRCEELELEMIAKRTGPNAILKWLAEQAAARKRLTDPDIPEGRWAENRAANYRAMLEHAIVELEMNGSF